MAKTTEGRNKRGSREEERRKSRKSKRENTMEVKKIAEEWEIWDKEEETVKLDAEAKKLVPEQFHR